MQRRLTKQKELILNIVRNNYNHPTAEDVYLEAKKVKDDISRGTVYRNLHLLSEEGYIKEITSLGNFSNRYDFRLNKHFHVVCDECGAIDDLETEVPVFDISNIQKKGYKINSCEIIFRGICSKCKNKKLL